MKTSNFKTTNFIGIVFAINYLLVLPLNAQDQEKEFLHPPVPPPPPTVDQRNHSDESSPTIKVYNNKESSSTENSSNIRIAEDIKPPSYSGQTTFLDVKDVPNPRTQGKNGFISDPNSKISAEYEQLINAVLWDLENETTAQVALVVVESIGNHVPKEFATKLFNHWGIGQADVDNGLLIFTVMDQRRTEFEVGTGLEPILTDVICFRIGKEEIVPFFKQGDYGKGLLRACQRVSQFIKDPSTIHEIYSDNGISYLDKPNKNTRNVWDRELNPNFLTYLLLYFGFGLIYTVERFFRIFRINKTKQDYYDNYVQLRFEDITGLWYLFVFLFPIITFIYYLLKKKKLKEYRTASRFSKKNGKPMKLLNNHEEKEHLKRGQIIEENLNVTDYDVWVTPDKSDILILAYDKSSRDYKKCKHCGYKTFGLTNTFYRIKPTYDKKGKRVLQYACKNCNLQENYVETVPKLTSSSSSSRSSSSSSGYRSSSSSRSSSRSFGGGSSRGGGSGVSW